MNKVSDSIANLLWEQGILQDDDISKCSYGLDIFISSIVEVLSILIISAFVKNFVETLMFFLAFIPLRIYAGGYHAETRIRCFLVSLAVYGIFTGILKLTPGELYLPLEISLVTFSAIITLVSSPVVHHNKNVNDTEIKNYRSISLKICFTEIVIIFVLALTEFGNKFAFIITLGQAAVTISMIIAIIKNKFSDNK